MSDQHIALLGGDTETSGLDPKTSRIVEVALMDFDPMTGLVDRERCLHLYFNPEVEMSQELQDVHGLSNAFVAGQPLFKEQRDLVINALEGRTFVAHNARFDVSMLEAEFKRTKARGAPVVTFESLNCKVVDTLAISRGYLKTKSGLHNLDVLLEHFELPATGREQFHGALVDVMLLASVYPHLMRVRAKTISDVSRFLGFNLDDRIGDGDFREIVQRMLKLEELKSFLEREKTKLEDLYVAQQGRNGWSDGDFQVSVSQGVARVDWKKVQSSLLPEVDLTSFMGPEPKASLKFQREKQD